MIIVKVKSDNWIKFSKSIFRRTKDEAIRPSVFKIVNAVIRFFDKIFLGRCIFATNLQSVPIMARLKKGHLTYA